MEAMLYTRITSNTNEGDITAREREWELSFLHAACIVNPITPLPNIIKNSQREYELWAHKFIPYNPMNDKFNGV